MFDKSIFKAYDIRGLYPEQVNADLAFKLGQAFAVFMKKDSGKNQLDLVVGQDMRLSSPELFKSLTDGIVSQGVNVVDVGLVSTPSFYFSVAKHGFDGGIMVSASHNPPQYNGFKMVRAESLPISGETGIMQLSDMIDADYIESEVRGEIRKLDNIIDEHVEYALGYADLSKIKPFKVVVDTANAMGGPIFEKLFEKLPCELIKLNFELDGNMPSHEADPLKDKNNKQIQDKVREVGADFGIVLDGDADRIFFIDNTGKTIEPAMIRGILAQIFLKDNPGATICYDIRPGKITIDMIEEAGGKPVVTKVGHSLIKEKAREVDAVFAGESSGHFFLKMPFGIFEMPMIMALKILEKFSEVDKSVSEQIAPLDKYFHSGEINFSVEDKQAVFDRLKEKYGENLKYDFDGFSFEWSDWWFNVRASNTGNKVRLNLESITDEVMQEKRDEVIRVIKGA